MSVSVITTSHAGMTEGATMRELNKNCSQARRDGHVETDWHGDLLNRDNVSLECIIISV